MADRYIECPELEGKIVGNLRIYNNSGDSHEVLIEFTDGTSFSCCFEVKASTKGSLFRGGVGTPEVLREYNS